MNCGVSNLRHYGNFLHVKMTETFDEKLKYCSECGQLLMKYAVEPDVYALETIEKGCKRINVELKCRSRGCNTFNNFVLTM